MIQKIKFYCSESVKSSTSHPCSAEWLKEQLDNTQLVKGIEAFQASGDRNDKARYLPVIYFHAWFPNGDRSDNGSVPSGLIALDVDDHSSLFGLDPDAHFEKYIKPYLNGRLSHILMVYKTPSGRGLRIVAKRRSSKSILDEQRLLFAETCFTLPKESFDDECFNPSRAFFIVPREYIYYINEEELFGGDMTETFAATLSNEPSTALTLWNEAKANAENAEILTDENGMAIEAATAPETETELSLVSPDVLSKISDDGLFYGDVSYETLRSELCRQLKCTGRAGTRNNDTYKIACQLAHICRNEEHLYQVLPKWGLPEKEMRELAKNGFKTLVPGAPISMPLSKIITAFQSEEVSESAPAMPNNLPKAFKVILEPYPETKKKALAISVLPALGTLATAARFRYYEDEIHSLSFVTHLMAPPAGGKSSMVKLNNRILQDLQAADDIAREKIVEYKDEKDASGQTGQGPKNPHYEVRNFDPKTTYATFMDYMVAAKGKHLMVIAPEVSAINTGEWWDNGNSALISFDNEKGGRETKTSTTAHVPLYCNMSLSGTPDKSIKMYKDIGDGLVTRIAFCTYEEERGEIYIPNKRRTPANDKALDAIINILSNEKMDEGIVAYELKKIEAAIHGWCNQKGDLFKLTGEDSIETFRKRAAVIGFRAGAVAWLLEGKRETKAAIDFAIWVAEYTLFYQRKFFGKKANEDMEANRKVLSGMKVNNSSTLFGELKTDFETADLVRLYQSRGQAGTGSRSTINRWIANGWVERLSNGKYKKTYAGIQICDQYSLVAS